MRIGLDGIPLSELKTGVGHYTYELARHLALVAPSVPLELVSHLPYHPTVLADLHSPAPNLSLVQEKVNTFTKHWWTIGLPMYIKKRSLTIFHGTNYDVPLWGGCPTVLTIHDLSLLLYPETHEKRRVRRARYRLPLMAYLATLIIVPTQSVKNEVCNHLGISADKVVVIHEAPRSCFYPAPHELTTDVRRRLRIEKEFILFVGTIEPRKNILTLIRSFEELVRTVVDCPQLVIAGRQGWLNDELFAHIASAGLANRLSIIGYVSDDDLRALYSSCLVMVFPTLYEGSGLPPLEAMACGAPVITTQTPAISEMVGDGACLISPTDYEGLTRNLIELLANRCARQTLAAAGLNRAKVFTWDFVASATLEAYSEALGRHRR